MEALANLVKVSLPRYLQSLPLPSSIGGIFSLSGSEAFSLVPFVGAVSFIVYATVKAFIPAPQKPAVVNDEIKKDNPKVVDLVEIEDLDKAKTSYCRCWKSKKFPFCDGSHNKHNEVTGDNVGPIVIKKKEAN